MSNFETSNRDLEQFLWVHGFVPTHTEKTPDFLTKWAFEDTPDLQECLKEYPIVLDRRHRNRPPKYAA